MKRAFIFFACLVLMMQAASVSAQVQVITLWRGNTEINYNAADIDSITIRTIGESGEKQETEDGAYIINGHKFIDLGLPSGLLWAESNIGAETAFDDGNYYAWGETKPKSSYNESTYSFYGDVYSQEVGETVKAYTKYNDTDGMTTLAKEDDAAYVNWGSSCRMPTKSEFDELTNSDNCTWGWVSRTNSAGETINCYKVVSKQNGNVIYLPASGDYFGSAPSNHNSHGIYWSSTIERYSITSAYRLYFFSGDKHFTNSLSRYYGMPVRPVAEK